MGLPSFVLKASVDLATALSFHWSLTPPNPPAAKQEVIARGLFEKTIRMRAILDKAFIWAVMTLDIAISYNIYKTHGLSSRINESLPSTSIVGALICVVANLWRLWAFAALGKLFDFEFRIQSNHRLITVGPYQYVRHPSYTGLFALYIGATIVSLSKGHWFREFGSTSAIGIVAGTYWFFEVALVLVALTRRMNAEDRSLAQAFGKEWDAFSQRVAYRLLPGIY